MVGYSFVSNISPKNALIFISQNDILTFKIIKHIRGALYMYPIISENEHYRITEQYFVMSDNIGLYTRIIAPRQKEKCPIVFIRNPYVLNHSGIPYDIEECETDNDYGIFLKHGYAVVFQHCRGCGISEGICIPYSEEERRDGLESLELIRKLSIYDGEIYLFGGSYLASVHYLYLSTNPQDVKAAALHIQTDRMFFLNMRNGCRYVPTCEWWFKRAIRKYPYQKYGDEFRRPYKDMAKRVVGCDAPEYNKLLMSIEYDDFWKNDPRTNLMDELKIPVLFTEGWYDFYNYGMFSMWERLNPETKKKSLFAVGPWGHSTKMTSAAEYAMPNGNLPEDFWVEWFNSFHYNRPFKYGECGKIKYYSIGADEWKISGPQNGPGSSTPTSGTSWRLTPHMPRRSWPSAEAARSPARTSPPGRKPSLTWASSMMPIWKLRYLTGSLSATQ